MKRGGSIEIALAFAHLLRPLPHLSALPLEPPHALLLPLKKADESRLSFTNDLMRHKLLSRNHGNGNRAAVAKDS